LGIKAILTDGREVFNTKDVNFLEEVQELNRLANESTDGNLYWFIQDNDDASKYFAEQFQI
jgi:hypothetical protein